MATKKTIYILRHGKAEVGAAGQGDRDRALVARGMEASRAIGEYLAGRRIAIDKVLCSGSVRTRQTWAQLQTTYGKKPPVEFSDRLYLASPGESLKLIASTAPEIHSLLVIGHNPGLHQLAAKLAKEGDEETLELLEIKFPTCALATIAFEGEWCNVSHAHGTLTDFLTPKMLAIAED